MTAENGSADAMDITTENGATPASDFKGKGKGKAPAADQPEDASMGEDDDDDDDEEEDPEEVRLRARQPHRAVIPSLQCSG